eukprot:s5464_g2.t1
MYRPKSRCQREALSPNLAKVFETRLFPFEVGSLRNVLLDHLERIFDLGRVYHDFYAGTLKENGGPLELRASLVKKLSEFAFGNEGDPEGYAYPQPTGAPPALPKGAISPTSSLELIGNFFYHAHSLEQCPPAPTCAKDSNQVPLVHYHRVAPLHMRKAFCNYYHFTTVALSRLVALLPRLQADPTTVVLIPHPNKKGQRSPFIRDSLQLLGLEDHRIVQFPPCRVVFASEVLLAGAGPRAALARDAEGRARAIMADVADAVPTRRVRNAVLARTRVDVPGGVLLIDRRERRVISNLQEVRGALTRLPKGTETRLMYCENLTFVEQVSGFAAADAAVAVSGACLANSLYMREGSLVVDLVPVKNYMGADVVMPLHCGVTWFWTLTQNVGVRYRSLMVPEGDLDADTVEVPAEMVRELLLQELPTPKAEAKAAEETCGVDERCGPAGLGKEELCPGKLVAASPALCSLPVDVEILREAFLKRREVSDFSESKEDFITSYRKLSHDCEMLAYLEELGHLQPPYSPLCRALHAASAKSYAGRPTQAFVVRIPEGDPRRGRFQQLSRALLASRTYIGVVFWLER